MTILLLVLTLGVGTTFWGIAGLIRLLSERKTHGRHMLPGNFTEPLSPSDVAVIVAAHNEGVVISETIRTAATLVPMENIHVISDGSADNTATVARAVGANVLELNPNRGKAGALAAGIEYFELGKHFEVVLLLDADTHLSPDYMKTGLPLFRDPEVVAVAGRVSTIAYPESPTLIGRFLVAYRERLYVLVQLLLKYGQAARHANVISIVPGFASMYRASAIASINISAPGLVIEDFNMTFEIHAKKLGRIAFHPEAAIAYTQDPDSFTDYVKQVRRWTLGFWQTVRRHPFQLRRFWIALSFYLLELLTSSLMLVLLLPLFAVSLTSGIIVDITADHSGVVAWVAGIVRPENVLLGVLVPDYILTFLTALLLGRPRYLLFGLAFPLMRIVDSWICLVTLPLAWSARSSGVWTSPTRRIQHARQSIP